jgi:hypothetical protein
MTAIAIFWLVLLGLALFFTGRFMYRNPLATTGAIGRTGDGYGARSPEEKRQQIKKYAERKQHGGRVLMDLGVVVVIAGVIVPIVVWAVGK